MSQVGEPRAGGRGDLVRGAFQGGVVDGEPARLAATGAVGEVARALAHRRRGPQRRGRTVGLVGGGGDGGLHQSSPRPLAFFSSSASGTGPGVK